jgi:alkanesulfonate monooxygenase SsuD/methylene tetrahydromethanopterin reductase-like flavin-dependent oxidoreductase (luciferase family)
MKELWSKDAAEFHGKFYDFPPVKSLPKPAQQPHPPIYLGGSAANVFKRVAEWGDGWMPTRATPDDIKRGRATLDGLARAAGRNPRAIEITIYGEESDPDLLKRYEDAGADRAIVRPPTTEGEAALTGLERIAERVLA